ncbi:NAD(P)/FAD-dependent oxidoreductase [Sedimentitalea sp. XS_ASV28]|uniref:NAD(P)/FAD-dependent oxidoreductase n=1 Tax=Sedimentitalea sp. XS_ASV28 TaxID=3241296 RepID=UPI0035158FE9
MTNVTILGTGFAALTAARKLRAADKMLEITVVAPEPRLVYLPSLIWLPSGQRKPHDIVVPLESFFRRHNIRYVQAAAEGLGEGGRLVKITDGEIRNDGLIIGTGGKFIKKLPGIEHALTPCEGVAPVMAFKERLEQLESGTLAFGFSGNPKEGTAMRGGPMFEFLFGTDELLRRQGRRDRFKLVFFSPAPKPGIRLGEKALPRIMRRMKELGIETHLGHKMVRFEPNLVVTEGGEFDADLILFMPGITGNPWFDNTDLPRSPGGLIKADDHCRVPGFTCTYVAGDAGSFPGPDWMPKQAHMADLQATAAAANLVDELKGKTPRRTFRVELMCVIDDNKSGTLVARTPRFNLVLPRMGLAHRSKVFFERMYLRRYR